MPELNEETGKWEVKIKDANGGVLDTKEFSSQGEADVMYRATIDEAIKKAAPELDKKKTKPPTAKEQIQNQESLLEQKLKNLGAQPAPSPGASPATPGQPNQSKGNNWLAKEGVYDSESINKEMQQFKDDFDSKKKGFDAKAKAALNSIAKLYLGEKIFTKEESVKYMLEVEEMNLSALMHQLHVAHEGIFKLSQYIALGAMNSRLWEVLGNLQKTMLEITKFQHEYIMDIPEMMKKIREDVLSGNTGDVEEIAATVVGSGTNTSGTSNIPDRKQIIDGLNEQLASIQPYMAIPSKNKKLIHEADDAAYIEETTLSADDETNIEGIYVDNKRGLSSYEDDADEDDIDEKDDMEEDE